MGTEILLNSEASPRRMNKNTTLLIVVLLTGLIYVAFALWGGWHEFIGALKSLTVSRGLLIVALVTTGYFLRFLRWHYYLNLLGFNVPWLANLRIFIASFLMALSPGKVGEAVKSYFLKREFDVPATPTVAGFFCERFTDVFSILLLCGFGFVFYPRGRWLLGGIFVSQILFLFLIQRRDWAEALLFRPLNKIDPLRPWVRRTRDFYHHSGELLRFKPLFIGTVIGFFSWGLEGYCLHLILVDMGITTISPEIAIFAFCAAVLLGAASMLPGGVGGSEAIMVAILIFFGLERSTAVSSTLIIRLITLWYGVAMGAAAWLISIRKPALDTR